MSVAGILSSSAAIPAQGFYQQRRADLLELAKALQTGDLSGAQTAFSALAALALPGSTATATSSAATSPVATNSSTAATSTSDPTSSSAAPPTSTSGPFSNAQLNQDFNAIGQALQSGDIAGAQKAFATFQQDLQNVQAGSQTQGSSQGQAGQVQASRGHHHRHHHHGGSGQSSSAASTTPDIILNLGNSGGSAQQITLNFANNGSSGEQLTIGVSNGSGSPEQVTVNFGSNSNPDIVLNLGSTGSASASPATAATTAAPVTSGQLNLTA